MVRIAMRVHEFMFRQVVEMSVRLIAKGREELVSVDLLSFT